MTGFASSTTFEGCCCESCSFGYVGTPMYVSYSTNIQENKSYAPTKIEYGKKMEQIPVMLNDWIDRKQFCRSGVSIKSVAKEIGINNNYLSKYLNNVLGITFHQWLHNLRIEEAKVLMKENPKIKLYEVAKAVGIPEEYNFSRWFKIITGMTANEWRVKSYQKTPLSD